MCDLRCREEFENVGTFIVLRRKTGKTILGYMRYRQKKWLKNLAIQV